MQNCVSEKAETFHGCFSVFVLVLYFKCEAAEINAVLFLFVYVLFQFCFSCAGTANFIAYALCL